MITRIIIALVLVLTSGWVGAQSVFIVNEDDLRVEFVDSLINRAENTPDSAEFFYRNALQIAEKIRYTKGVKRVYDGEIAYYEKLNNTKLQLRTLLSAIRYFEGIKEREPLIDLNMKAGDLYFNNGLFEQANKSYQKVMDLAENRHPDAYYSAYKKYAWSYQNVDPIGALFEYPALLDLAISKDLPKDQLWVLKKQGEIAHLRGYYEDEAKFAMQALQIAEQNNLYQEKLIALNNLAYAYKFLDQKDVAQAYFQKVIDTLPEPPNSRFAAELYKNVGILHQSQANYNEAVAALNKAASLYRKEGDTRSLGSTYNFLALTQYQNNELVGATKWNDEAIKLGEKYGHLDVLATAYEIQGKILEETFHYNKALESFRLHIQLRDSLDDIIETQQNEMKQQQFFLDHLQEDLNLVWAEERMKDLIIENLQIAKETERARADVETERARAAENENKRKEIELANQRLLSKQAYDRAKLAEEQARAREKDFQISELKREQEKKAFDLENERLRADAERARAQALEDQKKARELKIGAQASRIRNMTFLLIGLVLMVIITFWSYRRLRSKNAQIASQQKVIAAEKDKSDALLLNILPAQVATELKEQGASKPRNYDDITVVFTDFSGFTMISEQLSPAELVETLDKIFLEFDLISERHGLQRIKTIGDAYMCACGLPDPDDNHAENAVRAALEMRDYILKFNAELSADTPKWNIRIGVNSGPVVAGVVGIKKFAYDIWGDAVNVASRMESSGQVGKVNISGTTYELVKSLFSTEYRGKVSAKNKGDIDMYFVES